MPGGKNYMAVFFRDAGMEYPWASVDQSASLALSFEAVFNRCGNAPVWIGVPVDSLSQLLAMERRYEGFRALRDRRIYSLTNRLNSHGGNDYWESGPARPDRILEDLISIAHPGLVPGHQCYYFKPLIFD
jgi:iron complex transport system substrate-binding protein